MNIYKKTMGISLLIFIVLDIVFAFLAAERDFFEGMLTVAPILLWFIIPITLSILIGINDSRIWKMPLISAISSIVLSIIGYIWVIRDIKLNGCEEFGCSVPD